MDAEKTRVAMFGGGAYSLATKGAKDVIDGATPLVLAAIAAMPDGGRAPFTMSDMGCADGGTSADMVRQALHAVRAKYPQRAIRMVYTDQPRNDFNPIFQLVHGLDAAASPVAGLDDIYVMASATSFHERILPADTLDLGFSATAMHWLSSTPCDIPDHVQAVGATGAALAAFAERGRRDWEAILLHRAAELAPGGRLVLVNFCRDEEGRWLGHTGGVDMFGTFDALWRGVLAEGRITQAEYARMTFPQYYRSIAEFSAPLEDPESPVHRAGLRLEAIETRVVPCPYAAEFRRHGDAETFARAYVPTLQSWSQSTFFGALDPARPEAERRALVEDFYDAYRDLVRAAPEGHGMDYVHAYITIAKV